MKVTIHERLEGARVMNVVPPAYRSLLPETLDPAGLYSVLLFAHAERDVVPSAAVRRGFRRLGAAAVGGVIAVGTVFTREALDLLEAQHAVVIALRTGRWTDQSAHERQL